eukprot:CAMPEP_0175123810 /NCGR_PEP_ID=MMETSP0087-20121206/2446_1 /TAXON_ID=136419 /ORGANISM="Unknown Unknown, Strain D1" /LENGTH=188 /DNA_ID=CAMNT_0016405535 /DNA_START=190 /DNA_END=756 /DNA_ORIENTATION=-
MFDFNLVQSMHLDIDCLQKIIPGESEYADKQHVYFVHSEELGERVIPTSKLENNWQYRLVVKNGKERFCVDLQPKQRKLYSDAYKEMDVDGDGNVTIDDLEKYMEREKQAELARLGDSAPPAKVKEVTSFWDARCVEYKKLDINDDGDISVDEYVSHQMYIAYRDKREKIEDLIKVLDAVVIKDAATA